MALSEREVDERGDTLGSEGTRQKVRPLPTNRLDEIIGKLVSATTAIHAINCLKHAGTNRTGDHLGFCLRMSKLTNDRREIWWTLFTDVCVYIFNEF